MTDIVKGALGGAWTLIVGWILPTAAVMAVFGLAVLPSLESVPGFDLLATASSGGRAVTLLVAAVLLGGSCPVCRRRSIGCSRVSRWPAERVRRRTRHYQKVYGALA